MKKCLSFVLVLLIATGLSVGFQQGMSGTSEASPADRRLERERLADRLEPLPEGASLSLRPAGTGSDEKSDKDFARAAATTGDRLLDRARQSPDNPHLLRQATAYYRAALAHEPTVRDADDLFAAVREKLTEIARLDRPGIAKPTPTRPISPTIVKAPPPALTPEAPAPIRAPRAVPTPALIMVGPDGVEIRRVDPPE